MNQNFEQAIKNELMYEFKRKDLPNKKKVYLSYLDKEWEDLVIEKNFRLM
jgi:hypothetical protein